MARCAESNAPAPSSSTLPPPASSAGVPRIVTSRPMSSCYFGQSEPGAHRRRGDHVVATCVTNPGQGVVLGTDHNPERTAPRNRPDRRRNPPVTHLHGEPCPVQRISHTSRRPHLFERCLRVAMNNVAQSNQFLPGMLDHPLRYRLGVRFHTDLLSPSCPWLVQRLPGPDHLESRVSGSLSPGPPSAHDGHAEPPTEPPLDRPRRHKGVDMSHPRCIMVSSRKHHRSVLRYRPDRGRDHVIEADPLGEGGARPEPRRWRLGEGPPGGAGPVFFAFSVASGLPTVERTVHSEYPERIPESGQ